MEDIKEVWDVFDMGKTNAIPMKELRTVMRALNVDLNAEELEMTRKEIDPEKSGFIKFENLLAIMETKLKEDGGYDDMMEKFSIFDPHGTGKIPNSEFKNIMMTMGDGMTVQQFEDLVLEADPSGEGSVDYAEFISKLCPEKPDEK